jgi:predicted unusual protein kinase regulating ubiquinone biosynthesis (AarF/ABC1/UbiB family)
VPDYSTERVLTMDYVAGTGVAALSGVRRTELDGAALAEVLFVAYLDQILLHGRFHADPHPGNVLVTDDDRLALLDLGMVGHVDPAIQDRLVKLLMAVGEGRGRDAADVAIDLGRQLEGFDAEDFRRRAAQLVERHRSLALGDLQAGALVAELTQTAAASGLRLPPELTLLGKALLNLDEVARTLDPTFDPTATIERRVTEIMGDKLRGAVSPAGAVAAAMEAKQFAEQFPGRVNQVMDALAAGQLTLNIQGVDEADIMRSVQKLANRVTAGLVVASLVVGAALIMQIETEAELFGYPALAIVLFLVAAAAGLWLVVSSLLNDLPQRHRRRDR